MMNMLEETIIYATVMHQCKIRKFNGIPFILHPDVDMPHFLTDGNCYIYKASLKTPVQNEENMI